MGTAMGIEMSFHCMGYLLFVNIFVIISLFYCKLLHFMEFRVYKKLLSILDIVCSSVLCINIRSTAALEFHLELLLFISVTTWSKKACWFTTSLLFYITNQSYCRFNQLLCVLYNSTLFCLIVPFVQLCYAFNFAVNEHFILCCFQNPTTPSLIAYIILEIY